MAKYHAKKSRSNRIPRRIWGLLIGIIIIAVAGMFLVRHIYYVQLEPVSDSQKTQIFAVKQGATVKQIADNLQTAHLIKSAWALELYVHSK